MSMIITQPAQAISLPAPRVAIDVRPATLEDFAFIDRLQTAAETHSHAPAEWG